jgi:hypothetical protein
MTISIQICVWLLYWGTLYSPAIKQSTTLTLKAFKESDIKLVMLNAIKHLKHLILSNMMCYGVLKDNIDHGLGQYCSSVPHSTSYRTQWSAITVY